MSDDPQDRAEALDEDVVDDVDDTTGDEYGEGLPAYPPERPLGVESVGVTALEEDAGESFAARTSHGLPEETVDGVDYEIDDDVVGQIVEPDASTPDEEAQQIADAVPGDDLGPEASAMHVERDT